MKTIFTQEQNYRAVEKKHSEDHQWISAWFDWDLEEIK